jgi:hypothetical protein
MLSYWRVVEGWKEIILRSSKFNISDLTFKMTERRLSLR